MSEPLYTLKIALVNHNSANKPLKPIRRYVANTQAALDECPDLWVVFHSELGFYWRGRASLRRIGNPWRHHTRPGNSAAISWNTDRLVGFQAQDFKLHGPVPGILGKAISSERWALGGDFGIRHTPRHVDLFALHPAPKGSWAGKRGVARAASARAEGWRAVRESVLAAPSYPAVYGGDTNETRLWPFGIAPHGRSVRQKGHGIDRAFAINGAHAGFGALRAETFHLPYSDHEGVIVTLPVYAIGYVR